MTVWAFSCDPGGTAGVLPVVRELQKSTRVLYFAYGKAREILTQEEENFIAFNSSKDILDFFGLDYWPKAFVTSMCSKDEIARELIQFFQDYKEYVGGENDGCPTIALQDYWGARLGSTWKETRPGYICVNDRVGKDIVLNAWPDYSADQIKIFGYPALDKYAGYDAEAEAKKVKENLGFTDDKPIILFGGQGPMTGVTFRELILALNEIKQDVYLVPRPHPRMREDFVDEIEPWDKALMEFKSGEIVNTPEYRSIQPLIAASTVTISMYSTVLVEAATMRKQNISMLYPDTGMAHFLKAVGSVMQEFPLVNLGCTAKATSRKELIGFLEKSFDGTLADELIPAMEEHFLIDGGSAKRVAEFVLSKT